MRRAGAFFSVTVQMNPHLRAAIAAIGEDAWTPIRYPRAIWDGRLRCWVSNAEVAEVKYTAFAPEGKKKGHHVTARLIVRRVRDLNRDTTGRPGRNVPGLALPRPVHRLPSAMIQAEEQHRDHA